MKVSAAAGMFLSIFAFTANADIIYFKDGLRTICQEKAWEEDGEIRCEYAGWVISYQKKDVLRIVKTNPEKRTGERENKPKLSQTTDTEKVFKKFTAPKIRGLAFYDPRRPYKYWTGKNTKHNGYKEAIQALSKKYKRTPEWIQMHMGDTNDLAQIHQNLTNPYLEDSTLNRDIPAAKTKSEIDSSLGTVFYNPRRDFPYWSDNKSKHKSYKEAIQALAQKYERPPHWIQTNMGDTNDLNEIHQNLKSRSKTN